MINLKQIAQEVRQFSHDEQTQVGCVLILDQYETVIKATNMIPKGIKYSPDRLIKPEKFNWIEHAERLAIYEAVKLGLSTNKATMIVTYYPCSTCARAIVACGISKLYVVEPDWLCPKWGKDFAIAKQMFSEAKVEVEFWQLTEKEQSKQLPTLPSEVLEKVSKG